MQGFKQQIVVPPLLSDVTVARLFWASVRILTVPEL